MRTLPPRVRLARYAARMAAALSRRLRGGSGTVISGRVLRALAPASTRTLAAGREVILVSGTNGKTSITALTAAALPNPELVGSNRDGANTASGVSGTLAVNDAPQLVLEIDEGWLPWAVRETQPRVIVLANLSRDQLSRHHEVGALAATWRSALAGVPVVVANADDPAVVWAALAARRQVWVSAGAQWTEDSLVCPECGDHIRQGETGWACDGCGLRSPRADWWVSDGQLCREDARVELKLDLPGRFNLTNAALAMAAVHAAGQVTGQLELEEAAQRLGGLQSVAGRYERVRFRGHDVRLLLAKNPAGWLELLDLMAEDNHSVVMLFNAEGVDGRDPSWLYDVSFTPLRGRTVIVQGRRATDLLVRLRMDRVDARRVPGSLAEALSGLPTGQVDVVGNYTAFQGALKEVRRG